MAIDVHTHFMSRGYLDRAMRDPQRYQAEVNMGEDGYLVRTNFWSLGRYRTYGPFGPRHYDWDARVAEMDRSGVEIQVLTATQSLMYHWADAELGLEVSQLVNDEMAEAMARHPGRLYGIASLPIQDVSASRQELDRAVGELGLKGVQILSNYNGRNIDDPTLWPIYERIEEVGVPLFVHPYGNPNEDRIHSSFLPYALGFPIEQAIAVSALICGGVLDRFPRLKVLVGHGGGAFLFLLGRLDRGYQVASATEAVPRKPPRAYLDQLYVDTLLHDEAALEYALRTIGDERMMFGTDWPFWMQDEKMHERISKVLDGTALARVLSGNAAELFGLR